MYYPSKGVSADKRDFYDDSNNVCESMWKVFEKLGGRPIVLRTKAGKGVIYFNLSKISQLAGFSNYKEFNLLVDKAIEQGILVKIREHLYGFSSDFRNKMFRDQFFDRTKYKCPVESLGKLTDQEILLLLCWYRGGITFNRNIDLTIELAQCFGFGDSNELRRAVERLEHQDCFNTLICGGSITMCLTSAFFCSFKEETVKTVFSEARKLS